MIDLEAIKRRLESATPGPWAIDGNAIVNHKNDPLIVDRGIVDANRVFIASAPSDIAAFIAEVERLQANQERLPTHTRRLKRIGEILTSDVMRSLESFDGNYGLPELCSRQWEELKTLIHGQEAR